MNQTIWKFALAFLDQQTVEMPYNAELLHVDEQDGVLTLWVRADPGEPLVEREIVICGTGHRAPHRDWPHVGSAVMSNGLVWHVFDGGQ